MLLIGWDCHPRFLQMVMVDTRRGEITERQLKDEIVTAISSVSGRHVATLGRIPQPGWSVVCTAKVVTPINERYLAPRSASS